MRYVVIPEDAAGKQGTADCAIERFADAVADARALLLEEGWALVRVWESADGYEAGGEGTDPDPVFTAGA